MNRSPAHQLLRAFVALVVTLVQLVGALHFSLVRHSYSAALGGVVHVHVASSAKSEAKLRAPSRTRESRAPSATRGTASCSADVCGAANAPQSIVPHFEASDAGAVAFGGARLLNESRVSSLVASRVLLCAPKTSPPV